MVKHGQASEPANRIRAPSFRPGFSCRRETLRIFHDAAQLRYPDQVSFGLMRLPQLYDVETGEHGSEIDGILVAKCVVPEKMDVLPGDGRDLFQHVERLLVAVALVTLEQL